MNEDESLVSQLYVGVLADFMAYLGKDDKGTLLLIFRFYSGLGSEFKEETLDFTARRRTNILER